MKKIVFICILVFLLVTISGCNVLRENDQVPIEMIAFNSLTDQEMELIPVSPKDAVIKKVEVDQTIKRQLSSPYKDDKVYMVTFNNTHTEVRGNLIVFVGLDEKTVVGRGFSN